MSLDSNSDCSPMFTQIEPWMIPANQLMLSHLRSFLKMMVENQYYEGKPLLSKRSSLSTFIEKLYKLEPVWLKASPQETNIIYC